MILQALCDYYQRKANDQESGIAPEGFSREQIPFLIRLNSEGSFISIEDTRMQDGKRLVGQKFLVPAAVSRTAGIKANLLWDKAEYSLGIPDGLKLADLDKKTKKEPQKYTEEIISKETESLKNKAIARHQNFIETGMTPKNLTTLELGRSITLPPEQFGPIRIFPNSVYCCLI